MKVARQRTPVPVGQKFVRWTVLGFAYISSGGQRWHVQCDCGNLGVVRSAALKNGHSKGCGCVKTQRPVPIGKTFGKWTVIGPSDTKTRPWQQWKVRCECGTVRDHANSARLRSGDSRSCGCTRTNVLVAQITTHDMSRTRIYSIWTGMKRRCINPNSKEFKRYGGRGITICPEWRDSFAAFFRDMETGYQHGLTIERVDNDGPYSKENCVWATYKQQNRNTSQTVWLDTCRGRMILTDAAEIAGIAMKTMKARIAKGITGEALFAPALGRWGRPYRSRHGGLAG